MIIKQVYVYRLYLVCDYELLKDYKLQSKKVPRSSIHELSLSEACEEDFKIIGMSN